MKSIRLIGKAAKEAFDNVKVLDKSMTELRKVTDETPQTYNKILSDASSTAKEIGTSIHGLIDSTADFARLGYSIGDSQQLAKDANIYAVVGDEVNGVDAATKSIISTMAAFKISANDSIKIVDKFNEVGNNYAISSGGIGVALERSASSMAAAGNTLDESIALIAAANSVVQNPESVGTAFKTITMRIRGAKTELEDAGLSTDGMATSVSKLRDEIRALSGVDIMQNDSTFKSTYQIMDDLSRKWKELSDIQKASITELIAGKRQGNIVSSLLENFDIARNALNSSLNSDGSAMAEHEKWLDSIEAKTNQLKAAFESLSVNTLSSALVGDIVQATTALVTFLDKTNVVKTSLAGLAAAGAIKTFTTLATGIANAAMQMDRLNSALDIVKAGNIGQSQLEQIIALTNNLSTSQLGAVMSAKALNNEQRKAILMARGLSEAEAESTLSTMGQGGSSIIKFFAGIKSGAKEAAAEASGLSKVIKGIGGGIAGGWNALGAFGKIGLVIAALTAAYKLADHFIVTGEEAKGKRKQKAIATGLTTKNNKRKAETKCKELLAEWEKRLALTNSEMLFSDFLMEWLEHHGSRIADSTYQEYKKNIHRIICPYFAEKGITLFDLKPQHIQDFYDYRMREHNTGAKTIHRYHANIHKALAYAVKMGRIPSNPADLVELPKAQEHQANFYAVDELKTVIDKAKGTQIEPVVMLAAWFGLRRGEIIGLRWSSINFDAKVLSITGVIKDKGESGSKIQNMYYSATAKTKSSLRSFPMNDEMIAYLKNLKAQQDQRRAMKHYNHTWDDFVCVRDNGDLIPLEYVSRAFPKLCRDCGLRELKLHELRHTNISLLLSEGASMQEVQEWAGHSNFSVTANTYAHIQAKSKSRLTDSISSLLG